MPLRTGTKRHLLLAKLEATYKVDPTPTAAANSILVSGLDVKPINMKLEDRQLVYQAAEALAKAVRNALNRYGGTIGGVFVEDIYIDDQHDEHDDTINKEIQVLTIRCEYTE